VAGGAAEASTACGRSSASASPLSASEGASVGEVGWCAEEIGASPRASDGQSVGEVGWCAEEIGASLSAPDGSSVCGAC
jgi:hypothetical protein